MRFSTILSAVLFASSATAAPSVARGSSSNATVDVTKSETSALGSYTSDATATSLEDVPLSPEPTKPNDDVAFTPAEDINTGSRYARSRFDEWLRGLILTKGSLIKGNILLQFHLCRRSLAGKKPGPSIAGVFVGMFLVFISS